MRTILENIVQIAREEPDRTAFQGRVRATYGELLALAEGMGGQLDSARCGRGTFAVLFTDEPQVIAAGILACLNRGAACVPVSPRLPAARIGTILETVPATMAFAAGEEDRALWSGSFAPPCAVARPGSGALAAPLVRDPHGPAYVFFTSGSTGRPKGILGKWESVENFLAWQTGLLADQERPTAANLTSPMFDAILRDLFTPLCMGGKIAVPAAGLLADSARPADWLEENGVTLLHTVPSMFRLIFRDPGRSAFLRDLFLSGERVVPADVDRWKRCIGEGARLHNLYGPTETTMIKFHHPLSASSLTDDIPIGMPLPGARGRILDEAGMEAAPGTYGELEIITSDATLGYLGPDGLETSHLAPREGGVAYRTGDIACRSGDGTFRFQGRKDGELKINGVRIHPFEIEAACRATAMVEAAVVVPWEAVQGGLRLGMAVVLAPGARQEEVLDAMRDRLPESLVPTQTLALGEIPRLLSGKPDLQILRTRFQAGTCDGVAPRNDSQAGMLAVFREILNNHDLGITDDFFRFGGHSLLAMQAISRIRLRLGLEIPLAAFFEQATVEGIERHASTLGSVAAGPRAAGGAEGTGLGELSDLELQELLDALD